MTSIPWGLTSARPQSRITPFARRARRGVAALARLHERLLGRPTFHLADRLEVSQWSSPRELQALQLRKLRRLVGHAAQNSPYYRGLAELPIENLDSLDDLLRLPLLTRHALRAHADELRWPDAPHRVLTDRTHGTSDAVFPFYTDRRRQAWDKANRLRGHRWLGFAIGDRELHLWPVDPPRTLRAKVCEQIRQCRDRLLNELQIDNLRLDDGNVNRAWADWVNFNPQRLTAYPSSLVRFLEATAASRKRETPSALRTIFLTGEVTFPWQREIIIRALGAPVVECYGLQEVGAISFECEHGSWHVSAESILLEVIRDGRPAADGEYGEVVATTLDSLTMPVIRYCTGDVVRAASMNCRCGRGLPVMPPVLGRVDDFLETDDGRLIAPAEAVAALSDVIENGTWQIRQAAGGDLELRVVETRQRRRDWPSLAIERLAKLIGRAFACTIVSVHDLERTSFGKCRYVQSRRTRAGLALPRSPSVKDECRTSRHHRTPPAPTPHP